MQRVAISPSFNSWRRAARRLIVAGATPGDVLFDDGHEPLLPNLSAEADGAAQAGAFTVPKRFVAAATIAADHRDADRWDLLYRLLWRSLREPRLMDNLTDADVRRLDLMAKAVRRDVHKMHAFVRFRKIDAAVGDAERYVAFHRPDHYIVRRAAPFFRERFGSMRWAILTPEESVAWDGERLAYGTGVDASAAPEDDALEDVWRTYYANIFNPARVKLKAMRAEMPARHWATLPETRIIPDLLRDAPARVEQMMATAAKQPKDSAANYLPAKRTLPTLREAVQGCKGCDLCCQPGVTQAVFGEGPAEAACILVGEQPGDTEDRAGRPFVGPAGQLMNELLEEAGLDREIVYVTNTVKHFRFDQRGTRRIHAKPLARHVNACLPWFQAEVEVLKPAMVVALGSTAAQAIMGRDFRVTQQRGQVMSCRYAPWFLATIHPSAILRIPEDEARFVAKAGFIEDMRKVAQQLRASA